MKHYLIFGAFLLLGTMLDAYGSSLLPVGSGFNNPMGLAVDASGNVFVADQGNNAVKEVLAAGGYTTVNVLGSGFDRPTAVAVDASGNVFCIDADRTAVKEILAAGGYATVVTLGSGFSNSLIGIAVDGAGNVMFADRFGTIDEYLSAENYATLHPVASSSHFSSGFVSGFVVDRNGNAFLVEKFVEEFFASSGYSSGGIVPVGPNVHQTITVTAAIDDTGNIFVSQYRFNLSSVVVDSYILKLDPSNGFSYEFAYTATPPNFASGIAIGGNALFLSGVTANAVNEITPVPTPVTLQEFHVD
jgi:streptogramin lyase